MPLIYTKTQHLSVDSRAPGNWPCPEHWEPKGKNTPRRSRSGQGQLPGAALCHCIILCVYVYFINFVMVP